MSSNKPVAEVRVGAVKAAIWPNQTESGVVRHNVTFSRIYKDAEGNWKSTSSFGRDDLLVRGEGRRHGAHQDFRGRQRPQRRPGQRTAVLTACRYQAGRKPRLFFLFEESRPFNTPAVRS